MFHLEHKIALQKLPELIQVKYQPSLIKSTGADYVIIGHLKEEPITLRMTGCLTKRPSSPWERTKGIFCCGEVIKKRIRQTFYCCETKFEEGLFNLSVKEMEMIVIALWALSGLSGTGLTAHRNRLGDASVYPGTGKWEVWEQLCRLICNFIWWQL